MLLAEEPKRDLRGFGSASLGYCEEDILDEEVFEDRLGELAGILRSGAYSLRRNGRSCIVHRGTLGESKQC